MCCLAARSTIFDDTLPSVEAAWTPPVFEPTQEETEARRRLAERCRECGLDALLPFVPLVERSLLHDRQPLQPLRGVGGRTVLPRELDVWRARTWALSVQSGVGVRVDRVRSVSGRCEARTAGSARSLLQGD